MTSNLRLINDAYLYLLELIDSGVEYPDAEWKASSRFDVSAEDLREMYDGEDFDHAAAASKRRGA